MKRITLQGIQRRGWANLRTKNWWMRHQVRIWSQEHHAWWRQNAMGYTVKDEEAGLFDFDDAYDRTKHCGPKKRIIFYAAVTTAEHQAPTGNK